MKHAQRLALVQTASTDDHAGFVSFVSGHLCADSVDGVSLYDTGTSKNVDPPAAVSSPCFPHLYSIGLPPRLDADDPSLSRRVGDTGDLACRHQSASREEA